MKFLPVTLLLLFSSTTIAKNLPNFVHRCKLADPLVEKCVALQVENFLPHLVQGVPGLKLPKLEPLKVSKLSSQSHGFKESYTDINVYGVKDLKIASVSFDFDVPELKLQLYFPRLEVWSIYKFQGKLLNFQLDSTGRSSVNATNFNAHSYITGKCIEKEGKKYAIFDQSSTNITLTAVEVKFSDLFKGNPALTEETNRILNENPDSISPEIVPLIENAINSIMLANVKEIFSQFSVKELFE